MTLAVDTPTRDDRSFRDNDDAIVDGLWVNECGDPVWITAVVLALRFDLPPTVYDPVTGLPLPAPAPVVHTIHSKTPGDPNGWVDPTGLVYGRIVVVVPHTVWPQYAQEGAFPLRRGVWDMIAVSSKGIQTCLVRGRFIVESGVATPVLS